MLFIATYDRFDRADYFQEAFGYWCIDAKDVPGTLGLHVEAQILRRLRKGNLWPIRDRAIEYSDDDVFDMIEFLHDYISKPLEGRYHDYGGCGYHYNTFDKQRGRLEFRTEMNQILRDYGEGYELSEDGEILTLGQPDVASLETAALPVIDPENVEQRVAGAVRKFRRYRSSAIDRRDAIRELVDVLEFLRPRVKEVLTSKDEADLFNIANNFAIRHHNQQQKADYDTSIWYAWMFYFYLATIHAVADLIKKAEK